MIIFIAVYSEIILFSLNVLTIVLAISCKYCSFIFPILYVITWILQLLTLLYIVLKIIYPIQYFKYKALLAIDHRSHDSNLDTYLEYMAPRKRSETNTLNGELRWLGLFLRRVGILSILLLTSTTSFRNLIPWLTLLWALCDLCAFSGLVDIPLYAISQHPIAVSLICPIQFMLETFVVILSITRFGPIAALWVILHVGYYMLVVQKRWKAINFLA
jgi:hypothetical protein